MSREVAEHRLLSKIGKPNSKGILNMKWPSGKSRMLYLRNSSLGKITRSTIYDPIASFIGGSIGQGIRRILYNPIVSLFGEGEDISQTNRQEMASCKGLH